MKTVEQLQMAVDELRKVCVAHGVVLVGTCSAEGIYGEITIGEAAPDAIGWVNVAQRLDNTVWENGEGSFAVGGIGDLQAP